MEATPSKAIDFFNGFKQSVVPLFQQQSEWDEFNWETLWSDALERYEADRDVAHFLGAILAGPACSAPAGVSKFLVIDGQQRLTTIALLMCTIRDSLPGDAKRTILPCSSARPASGPGPTRSAASSMVDRYRRMEGHR